MSTFDDLVAEGAAVDVSTWMPGSSPGGTTQVEAAGLTVLDSGEATVRTWWSDVGALVAYVRSVGPVDRKTSPPALLA